MKNERIGAGLALLIPIAALFGPALVSDRSFAFRDAAHFYYPLFEWCAGEWGAGRVPLWNPQENIGTPVLADASSSIFYPGKLIFAPPLDFTFEYKLYVAGHVLLAAIGSYWLARAWQASRTAAAVAGISFACGGGVVFQYSNVVFLVGASWLPLAALAIDRMLRLRSWRATLMLGICLAMMILGGDPQAAYHTLLIAGLYAVVLFFWKAPATEPDSALRPSLAGRTSQLGLGVVLIGAAACVGFLLAAVQVLPSSEATKYSERAAFNRPRNVYEAACVIAQPADAGQPFDETRWQSAGRGIFGTPEPGTHHDLAYDFSIGPWRLAEYLWPNFGGRMFPTKRRWFSLIPGEGRTWTPTLYLGLLPVLLALVSMRLRSGSPRERWLSWLVLIFTLGSFGWFGLGWLVREVYAAAGGDGARLGIGRPVGGIYWLMVTLLPTYAYFRYPAKLLPLVSLGLSQLAAIGWDRAFAERRRRLYRSLQILGAISAVAAFVVWCVGPRVFGQVQHTDASLGPFDAAGAYYDLLGALVQTMLVTFAAAWLLHKAWSEAEQRGKWQTLALVLTAVELAIANYWLVPTAPAALWRTKPVVAKDISVETNGRPMRVFRGDLAGWRPSSFARKPSADRLSETVQWEHDTLFPKYQLNSGVGLVESYGSIKLIDYESLWYVARQHGPVQADQSRLPHPIALRLVGTEHLVLPDTSRPAFAEPTASADRPDDWPEDTELWRMKRTQSRAWIVHEVESLSLLPSPARIAAVDGRSRQVLFPGGKARDFRRTAVVESDELPPGLSDPITNTAVLEGESCAIIDYEPTRITINAELKTPGLLVLSDAWHPGWTAISRGPDEKSQSLPILRTNRVMRGVWLPAGQQTVRFLFLPERAMIGGAISTVSWLIVAILGIAMLRQAIRSNSSAPASARRASPNESAASAFPS